MHNKTTTSGVGSQDTIRHCQAWRLMKDFYVRPRDERRQSAPSPIVYAFLIMNLWNVFAVFRRFGFVPRRRMIERRVPRTSRTFGFILHLLAPINNSVCKFINNTYPQLRRARNLTVHWARRVLSYPSMTTPCSYPLIEMAPIERTINYTIFTLYKIICK